MRTSSDWILRATFTTSGPATAARDQWIELELKEENHAIPIVRLILKVLERYDKGELGNYLKIYSKDKWSANTMDAERILAEEIATPIVIREEQS